MLFVVGFFIGAMATLIGLIVAIAYLSSISESPAQIAEIKK